MIVVSRDMTYLQSSNCSKLVALSRSSLSSLMLHKISFTNRKLLGLSVYEYNNSNIVEPFERTDWEYKMDLGFAPRSKRSLIVSIIPSLTALTKARSSANCSIISFRAVSGNASDERAFRRYKPVSLCRGSAANDLAFWRGGTLLLVRLFRLPIEVD